MPPGRPSRMRVYQRLDEMMMELTQQLGGLPSSVEAHDIWDDLWHQEVHHSTAIEGNTLVLAQVIRLLDEGRPFGAKPLTEYLEVQGYATAAKWVYAQGLKPGEWTHRFSGSSENHYLITMGDVRDVHQKVMEPVWTTAPHPNADAKESPGNWRCHDIQPFSQGMKPPPFLDVQALMGDWVESVQALRVLDGQPLPERLAKLHNEFEQIHPFLDGNGRTGRLLLNLILVRLGYPPAIILKRQRTKYLRAMQRADANDFGPLGELITRSVLDNLNRFVVPAVAGPSRAVSLESLVETTDEFTFAALRVAATRGRLRAYKSPSGVWMSSGKWLEEYRQSRHKRENR